MDLREREGRAVFLVENTGEHIPEEELMNIRERFYKIDKSRNREREGNSLGLPIIKDILELHGSSYGARNTDDGVVFYFDLQLLSR